MRGHPTRVAFFVGACQPDAKLWISLLIQQLRHEESRSEPRRITIRKHEESRSEPRRITIRQHEESRSEPRRITTPLKPVAASRLPIAPYTHMTCKQKGLSCRALRKTVGNPTLTKAPGTIPARRDCRLATLVDGPLAQSPLPRYAGQEPISSRTYERPLTRSGE